MTIAVIGAGQVGRALGEAFRKAGHSVTYGGREAHDDVVTIADAAEKSEIVVFAVPYSALAATATNAGNLDGKVLIDCTNPIAQNFSGLLPVKGSAAEELANIADSKLVVKAFNTIGFGIMQDPSFGGVPATLLIAGDDSSAKKIVMKLAQDIGFAPEDAGPLSQAHLLEQFAWLWITMAMKFGHGRDIVFQLVKR